MTALAYVTQTGHGAVVTVMMHHGGQMQQQQQWAGGYGIPQGTVYGVPVAQSPVYGVSPQTLQGAGSQGGYGLLVPPYPHPPRWTP